MQNNKIKKSIKKIESNWVNSTNLRYKIRITSTKEK